VSELTEPIYVAGKPPRARPDARSAGHPEQPGSTRGYGSQWLGEINLTTRGSFGAHARLTVLSLIVNVATI